MSPQRLPEQIVPFKLARQRRLLQGVLKLDTMARLSGLLVDKNGDVDVNLQFDIDAQGISYMSGHLKTQVSLVCQRCMEPVVLSLESEVAVGFVTSEERVLAIPDVYEPYLLMDEVVVLSELIEDELIMAIPIVVAHPQQSCQPWFEKQHEALSDVEEKMPAKKNPFAVLASLKRDS